MFKIKKKSVNKPTLREEDYKKLQEVEREAYMAEALILAKEKAKKCAKQDYGQLNKEKKPWQVH